LILTWNTGRQGEASPALGFTALQAWWQAGHQDVGSMEKDT
jgi:hypothetical protein